jgi:hypothetical protein
MGSEPVGRYLGRCEALLLQQPTLQHESRGPVAPRLDQGIEDLAFVVDRTPQPVIPPRDLDEHLVKVPARTGAQAAATEIAGNCLPIFKYQRRAVSFDTLMPRTAINPMTSRYQGEPQIKPNALLHDRGGN